MSNNDGSTPYKEGLMHEINALFAPPSAESYGKKGLPGIPSIRRARKANESNMSTSETCSNELDRVTQSSKNHVSGVTCTKGDPFWKKPRANCHEFCDSCGCIEGERLVCDRCPASFHLECLDPPLEPDEAPIGVWFCHRCSMLLKDEEDKTSTSSSQTTIPTETGSNRSIRIGQTYVKKQELSTVPPCNQHGQLQNKRPYPFRTWITDQLLGAGRSSRSAVWGESAYVADIEESELKALWEVIEYAQYQNPKEYELPKDLMPGIKLPGSYKTLNERKNKSIIELENGIIPRPIRRCYVCARTCFYAPLLPCDYCSSCFHLECLDPPLSHFPPRSDRWMCPNHTEHTTDRYLVRSIRLTERMHLWTKLADFDDEIPGYSHSKDNGQNENSDSRTKQFSLTNEATNDSSNLDFIQPIAPYELTYGPDEESIILTDLMRTIHRSQMDLSNFALSASSAVVDNILSGRSDLPEKPKHFMWRLNRDLAAKERLHHNDSRQMRIVVPEAVKSMYNNPVKKIPRLHEQFPYQFNVSEGSDKEDKNTFVRGLLEFYLQNHLDNIIPPNLNTIEQLNENSLYDLIKNKLSTKIDHLNVNNSEEHNQINLNSNNLNISSSLLLLLLLLKNNYGLNELKQNVVEENKEQNDNSINQKEENENKNEFLKSSDIYPISSKLKQLDPRLIYLLASQRISELCDQNAQPSENFTDNLPSDSQKISTNSELKLTDSFESCLRARAVLTPCDNTCGLRLRMQYRQLRIGTDPDCHLCLSNYKLSHSQKCQFVSSHHATIFYDDWTHHFELINYSEFGTRVDGILYGNNISTKSVYAPKPSPLIRRVRNIIQNMSDEFNSKASSPNVPELSSSPPKRFTMMMLSRRHEDMTHLKNDCECTSLDLGAGPRLHSDKMNKDDIISGWEGPAILRHGSVIQFGCYKFVLGLVDQSTPDPSSNLQTNSVHTVTTTSTTITATNIPTSITSSTVTDISQSNITMNNSSDTSVNNVNKCSVDLLVHS